MVKQQIRVVVRTRPTPNFPAKNIEVDTGNNTITITIPKQADKGLINNQQESWKYKFDKILHNASQEDLFEYCARDTISSVLEGYNGTIMCYGQTGAGKTFTMIGSSQNYKYRGIIPRVISSLFQEIGSRFEQAVTVKVSYIEIYNELMFDLLSTVPTHEQSGADISIQDDAKGGIHVKGLSTHICTNEEDALNHLFEGETNRTISQHQLNSTSSRSHCIFTIYIESKSRVESREKVVFSKLNLVDLAGSERTKKTGSEGIILKEANYINKSLSFLEQVVISACEKGREHIPYRQSKLTNLLKDSIAGNSKTILVANIWPEPAHLEETNSTLKFGTRMMRVSNEAVINVQLDAQQLIKKYEKEIRELKQELAMHDTLANRGRITYEPYSADQQFEIQKTAEKFLKGEVEDIDEISSLRQVRELFYQFRNIYRKMEKKVQETIGAKEKKVEPGPEQKEAEEEKGEPGAEESKGVGDAEETAAGFGLGKAPKNAGPKQPVDVGVKGKVEDQQEDEEAKEGEEGEKHEEGEENKEEQERIPGSEIKRKKEKKVEVLDRQTAFSEFSGRATESRIILE